MWHVEVQEELDELKQEKRKIKKQIQLADGIIKEDLYTAYYAVSENEVIVADREIEIPGMEVDMLAESTAEMVVESNISVTGMKSDNNQNEIGRQKKPTDGVRKQPTDLDSIAIPEIHNSSDVNVAEMDKSITDVTGKSEFVEIRETEPVDKVGRIVRRISELGGYENISDSVKADIFGFDIADISGSIGLFSDVMKKFGIKLDGMSFMRSFRGVMMRVLIEMSVKIKQKIRCGIGAEEDDSSADLFYNLKKVFEKSNKVFYNKIEIIYNKIVKLYS